VHDSLLSSVADRLHQVFCGLRGHESYLCFEDKRVYLRCSSCGHETPGWATGKPHGQIRVATEPSRWSVLTRLPVFGARRTI
jgi:hypothetical protein